MLELTQTDPYIKANVRVFDEVPFDKKNKELKDLFDTNTEILTKLLPYIILKDEDYILIIPIVNFIIVSDENTIRIDGIKLSVTQSQILKQFVYLLDKAD